MTAFARDNPLPNPPDTLVLDSICYLFSLLLAQTPAENFLYILPVLWPYFVFLKVEPHCKTLL